FIAGSIAGPGLFRTGAGEMLGFAIDDAPSKASCLGFRPERAILVASAPGACGGMTASTNTLVGRVAGITYLGHVIEYKVATAESRPLVVLETNRDSAGFAVGDAVCVQWAKGDSRLLE